MQRGELLTCSQCGRCVVSPTMDALHSFMKWVGSKSFVNQNGTIPSTPVCTQVGQHHQICGACDEVDEQREPAQLVWMYDGGKVNRWSIIIGELQNPSDNGPCAAQAIESQPDRCAGAGRPNRALLCLGLPVNMMYFYGFLFVGAASLLFAAVVCLYHACVAIATFVSSVTPTFEFVPTIFIGITLLAVTVYVSYVSWTRARTIKSLVANTVVVLIVLTCVYNTLCSGSGRDTVMTPSPTSNGDGSLHVTFNALNEIADLMYETHCIPHLPSPFVSSNDCPRRALPLIDAQEYTTYLAHHVCTFPSPSALVVSGPTKSGKTFGLRAMEAAWQKQGRVVFLRLVPDSEVGFCFPYLVSASVRLNTLSFCIPLALLFLFSCLCVTAFFSNGIRLSALSVTPNTYSKQHAFHCYAPPYHPLHFPPSVYSSPIYHE